MTNKQIPPVVENWRDVVERGEGLTPEMARNILSDLEWAMSRSAKPPAPTSDLVESLRRASERLSTAGWPLSSVAVNEAIRLIERSPPGKSLRPCGCEGEACKGHSEPNEPKARQVEPFVVKHYASDERPTIKGNGFDGLEVGTDREDAEEFVKWLNERLAEPSGNAEQMEKALGKIYRLAARGMKEFPETFPIGKVRAIAEQSLGDRLEAQKSPMPTDEGAP